jgi:hypothetical protein
MNSAGLPRVDFFFCPKQISTNPWKKINEYALLLDIAGGGNFSGRWKIPCRKALVRIESAVSL